MLLDVRLRAFCMDVLVVVARRPYTVTDCAERAALARARQVKAAMDIGVTGVMVQSVFLGG